MRLLKGILLGIISILLLLVVVYFVGPRADFEPIDPQLPQVDLELEDLDSYLAQKESKVANIKAENESRIIWADSIRQTEYAIVYLHGFSAGPMEGAPLHIDVARRYGMNIYLPRLSKHGIDDLDIFTELTPKALVDDAKEALVIGRLLGKNVILMSCSTGSTLAIYLSANDPDVFANIMYSPNISLFNPTGKLLTGPWGLQIVKKVLGDYKLPTPLKEPVPDSIQTKTDQYWTGTYRVEGLVALQSLIDMTMKDEIFSKINQPYFAGYYYKNDSLQDMTVSVSAILDFDAKTKTSNDQKRLFPFPEAGAHVINSPLISKQYSDVKTETFKYFEEVLEISPVHQ